MAALRSVRGVLGGAVLIASLGGDVVVARAATVRALLHQAAGALDGRRAPAAATASVARRGQAPRPLRGARLPEGQTARVAFSQNASPPAGPRAADAAAALGAFNRAFHVDAGGVGFYRRRTGSGRPASFWQTAQFVELAAESRAGTADSERRAQVAALMRGVSLRYGTRWTAVRTFNDDVMWMVLAWLRAHDVLGDRSRLAEAKANFDRVWERAWSADLGGGLWWTTACREKNACVNGPAAIAAGRLAVALDDDEYLERSIRLYAWLRDTLFEEETGRVNDHLSGARPSQPVNLDRGVFTYNQGTFIGASDLLERLTGQPSYREDGLRALAFTQRELAPEGLLRSEGRGGDGGGFKGIFARYAVPFVRRLQLREPEDWLWQNARAVWMHRDARGLIDEDWASSAPTLATAGRRPVRDLYAWDVSSAVALLQALTSPEHGD